MTSIPSFKPKCPDCGEQLEGLPFPLPNKGEGRCPVGMCMVTFEVDLTNSTMAKGKDGKLYKTSRWKMGDVKPH